MRQGHQFSKMFRKEYQQPLQQPYLQHRPQVPQGPGGHEHEELSSVQSRSVPPVPVPTVPAPTNSQTPELELITGVVTNIQDGFGMISGDVFFLFTSVVGRLPHIGDKVVVEASPASGVPFKFTAKKVQVVSKDFTSGLISSNSQPQHPIHVNSSFNPVRSDPSGMIPVHYGGQQQPFRPVPPPPHLMDFGPLPELPSSLNLMKKTNKGNNTGRSRSRSPKRRGGKARPRSKSRSRERSRSRSKNRKNNEIKDRNPMPGRKRGCSTNDNDEIQVIAEYKKGTNCPGPGQVGIHHQHHHTPNIPSLMGKEYNPYNNNSTSGTLISQRQFQGQGRERGAPGPSVKYLHNPLNFNKEEPTTRIARDLERDQLLQNLLSRPRPTEPERPYPRYLSSHSPPTRRDSMETFLKKQQLSHIEEQRRRVREETRELEQEMRRDKDGNNYNRKCKSPVRVDWDRKREQDHPTRGNEGTVRRVEFDKIERHRDPSKNSRPMNRDTSGPSRGGVEWITRDEIEKGGRRTDDRNSQHQRITRIKRCKTPPPKHLFHPKGPHEELHWELPPQRERDRLGVHLQEEDQLLNREREAWVREHQRRGY